MPDMITSSPPLSARIVALEVAAGKLPKLHDLRVSIVQEIQRQQVQLADVDNRIADGDRARILLQHLAEQADQVLGSERLPGASASEPLNPAIELPEPHELNEAPEAQPAAIQAEEPAAPAEAAPEPEEEEGSVAVASTPTTTEPDDEPYVTAEERLRSWAIELDEGLIVTNRSASEALDMAEKTAGISLPRLMKEGWLERVEGTGKPGVPSQYRRTAKQAGETSPPPTEQVEVVKPITPPPTPKPKPAPIAIIQRNAHLDRDLPPLKKKEAQAGPLECEQVFNVLRERGRPMSLAMITGRSKGLKQADVEAALGKLETQSKAERDQYGFWQAI